MSDVIDQRTVEMRFDNKDFERNVESSLGTIEKLKRSLNFGDSVKGLEIFERSLKSLDLRDVKENADHVSHSFKEMYKSIGDVFLIKEGINALTDLKRVAISTAKSMLQINQMKDGWNKYTTKVNSVQTIMAATGKSIDEVSQALEKLNWYTDETSYDFADMVSNIGKFTSSGVKLEDAVTAMQGISNWAATSGRGPSEAARAMYNLSQAIAIGSVKMMDWKSIQNANMDTVEFKNTVLDTGVAIGKLTKTGNDYYTKVGKKQKVTAQNFASTLNTGWFDSELLVATLKRYSEFTDKVYEFIQNNPDEEYMSTKQAMEKMRAEAEKNGETFDELGYKWFISAQEAKTLSDAVNATKDAISTGWMKTFELIVGDYEHAKELWSDIVEDMWTVFVAPGEERNNFLSDLLTTNYGKLKKNIKEAGLSIEEFEQRIYSSVEANKTEKESLDKLILEYGSLSRAIELGEVPTDLIRKAFVQLSASGEEVEKTIPTLEEVEQIMKDTWAGKYGNGEQRYEEYRKLGYEAEKLQKLVGVFAKKGKLELSDLEEVGIEAGQAYSKSWKEFVDANGELIESLDQLSGRDLLIGSLQNGVKTVSNTIAAVREGVGKVFSLDPEKGRGILKGIYELSSAFAITDERAEKLSGLTTNLLQPFKSVGIVAEKFIKGLVGDSFDGLIPKIDSTFRSSFNRVYKYQETISNVFKSLENSTYVNEAIQNVSDGFRRLYSSSLEKMEMYGNTAIGYFQKTFVGSAITKYASKWKNIWAEFNTDGSNTFDALVETAKKFKSQWEESHGENFNIFSALKDGIKNDFQKFTNSNLAENINSGLKKFVDKTFGKNSYEKIMTSAVNFSKKLHDFFPNVLGKLFQKTEEEPEGIKVGLNKSANTFKEKFFEIFQSITKINIPNIISVVSPVIKDPKMLFKSIKENWKTFINGFDSVIPAFEDAKKVFSNTFKTGKNIFTSIREGYKEFMLSFAENMTGGIFDRTGENALKRATNLFLSNIQSNISVVVDNIRGTADKIIEKAKKKIKVSKVGEFVQKYLTTEANGPHRVTYEELKKSLYSNILPVIDAIDRLFSKDEVNIKGDVTGSFKNLWDRIITALQKGISTSLTRITNLVTSFKENIKKIFKPDKKTTQQINPNSITNQSSFNLDILKDNLKKFWNWAKPLLKTMAETFSKSFNLQNLARFINSLTGFNLAKMFGNLNKGLKETITSYNLKNMSSELKKDIEGLIDAFSPLKETKKELKARSILEFAAAIGIIAGALFLISAIPEQDLIKAGIVVVAITAALAGIGVLISKLGNTKFEIALSGTGQVLKIIALILAISIALKNVGKAAKGIAEAIDLLVGAVEKFSDFAVNKIKFQEGVQAVQDLIFALGAASALAGLGLGNLFGGTALTILAFAGAIRILYDAVEKITSLSMIAPEELDQSIEAISTLIMKLGHASFWAGLTNGSWKDAGAAETILALTAAIKILQNAVITFASIPAKRLGSSVEAITDMLNSLGKASFWSGFLSNGLGGFGRAATIFAFGKAIEMFVGSVESIMKLSVDKEKFDKATETVKSIMSSLFWMTTALGIINRFIGGVSLSQAMLVVAFGAAIRIIGESIEGLGKLNRERLIQGGNAVGLIGVLIAGFTAVLGFVNKHLNLSIKELGSAAMIIAFAIAIGHIADTVIKLAELDETKMRKGLNVTWEIAGIVSTLTIVSSICNRISGKRASFSGASFLAIAGGLFIFGQAIEKLGGMDEKVLKRGRKSVILLAGVIAGCIFLMNLGAKVPSWTNAVNIAALAGAIWILADAAETFGNMDDKQIIKAGIAIAALLTALTLISRFGLKVGDIGTIFNSVSLLVIAGAVGILAQIAKSFADMEWPQLRNAGVALGGMVAAMWAISKFINIGSKISIRSVAKFGVIIAEVAGILTVLGIAMKSETVRELLTGGGDLIGKLGEAIGKFLGGVTSGTAEGVKTMLGQLGQGLNDFATKGQSFFDLMQSMKDVNIAETLLAIMGAETLGLVNSALNDWLNLFNGNTFKQLFGKTTNNFSHLGDFGQGLKDLAPGLSAFAQAVEGVSVDNLPTVTSTLSELNKISRQQQRVSGDPLKKFATSIRQATGSITRAIENLNTVPKLNSNGEEAIKALAAIAEIKMPSTVDVSGKMEGTFITFWASFKQTFSEFAADLSSSSGDFQKFIEATNKLEIEKFEDGSTKVGTLTGIIDALARIPMPASGGLFTIVWKDYSDVFQNMAKDLDSSMIYFSEFFKKVNKLGTIPEENDLPNMDLISNVIDIISQMSQIEPKMVPDDILIQSVGGMVDEFTTAVESMGELSDAIKKSGLTNITDLLSFLDADAGKTINTTFLDDAPGKLRKFVEDIKGITIDEKLTAGLQSVVDLLSPLEGLKEFGFTAVAQDITSGISTLASVNESNGENTVIAANGTVKTFMSFARSILRIQNGFNNTKFAENIAEIFRNLNDSISEVKSGKVGKMRSIREFFDSVMEIYSDKYHFELGVENKFGTLITALTNAIDMFSPNTSIDELKQYTDWMEALAGQQEMFASAGKAIQNFVVDKDKLDSVTQFISALKGEFNFSPGDSIKVTKESWDLGPIDVYEKLPGYFSKIANDLVLAAATLNGTPDKPVDFSGFDNFRIKLNNLASSIAHFVKSDDISVKLRELIKGINDAILGDGTDENPGIKDFDDKLKQFDSLSPIFDQLEEYRNLQLKDVVPDILTNITTAINDFTYDPNGIEVLKKAITGIKEALDILKDDEEELGSSEIIDNALRSHKKHPDSYDPLSKNKRGSYNSRFSGSESSGGKKVVNDFSASKRTIQIESEYNAVTSLADAINDLDIDSENANLLIETANSISDASAEITNANPNAMTTFVQSIADSITSNSDITSTASDTLVQDMLTVLEDYVLKFYNMGIKFVQAIAGGIQDTPDAIDKAAVMATRIMSQFSEAADSFGAEKGKEMLNSVLGGLTSDESKEAINSALNSLFNGEETTGTTEGNLQGEASEGISTSGKTPGAKFGESFINDFRTSLEQGAVSIAQDIQNVLAATNESVNMDDFSEGFVEQIDKTNEEIESPVMMLHDAISSCVPDGYSLGYNFVVGIRDGLLAGIADYGGEISSLAAQLGELMNTGTANTIESKSPSRTAMRLGSYFVEGLKIGVDKNIYYARNAGELVGNAVIESAKNTLEIASPSKVFYEIGEYVVQGFTNAVYNNADAAGASVSKMADLTASEIDSIISLLKKTGRSVYFKGRLFNLSDIDSLNKLKDSLNKADESAKSFSNSYDSVEKSVSGGGGGSSGGRGGGGASKLVEGTTEAVEELNEGTKKEKSIGSKLLDGFKSIFGLGENKDSLNIFGMLFPTQNIDDIGNDFDWINSQLDDLTKPRTIDISTIFNVKDDGISNGLGKDTGASLGKTTERIASSILSSKSIAEGLKKAEEKATEIKSIGEALKDAEVKSAPISNVVNNFTQNNYSPKALSRAEIYRQTKNQFAMLKGDS